MKKHQAVLAEINNHESRVAAVCQAGQQMVDDGHFAAEEIKDRSATLNDHWTQLKEKALQRKQDLEDSLQVLSEELCSNSDYLPSSYFQS